MKNKTKIDDFKKVNNDKRIYFNLTEAQLAIIQNHKDSHNLRSSKHMKLLVAWAFSNKDRIESFDTFIKNFRDSI